MLRLEPAAVADVPEIVDVWDVSFKDTSALDSVFFPRTPGVRAWWVSLYEGDFADDSARFLKVVDTATGRIAAYGKWYVPVRDDESNSGTLRVGGATPEDIAGAKWPDDYPARLCAEIFGAFIAARDKIMGRPLRPHYYLERVGVRPEYRGTGAGRQIIEWGLQRADADGLEAYVEAHQGVVKLYEKFGWRRVSDYENAEIGHLETFMLRPAKLKS